MYASVGSPSYVTMDEIKNTMKYNIINEEESRMAKLVNEIAFEWDPKTQQVSQLPIHKISKIEICDKAKKERKKRDQKYQSNLQQSKSTYNPKTDPYFNNPVITSIAQIQHEAQQKYIGGIRGTSIATTGNGLPNQHPLTVLPAPNIVTTPGFHAGTTSINHNPFGVQSTTPGFHAGTSINHNPFGLRLQVPTIPKNINGIHINHNPFAPTPTNDEL